MSLRMTARGSYAVRALVDLASQPTTRPVALREIAQRRQISVSYLEQLFLKLRRNELVRSVRGPGGGYLLTRDPETISVADVIEAVDERIEPIYCTDPASDRECSVVQCCEAHMVWEGLALHIREYLSSIKLDALARQSKALRESAASGNGKHAHVEHANVEHANVEHENVEHENVEQGKIPGRVVLAGDVSVEGKP
jgi:Rrf2 family iron-sulfur cluster assembly transcriptional regulator